MTHTIREIEKISTVKELAIIGKTYEIPNISKFKKEDLRLEIISKVKEALKGLPVDGPQAVADAIEDIELLLPKYFQTAKDNSSNTIPHLIRYLGDPLAKDTIVLHADFAKAGTKAARVYIIQKCFGQRNSTLHIFDARTPAISVSFLNLLKEHRDMSISAAEETVEAVKTDKAAEVENVQVATEKEKPEVEASEAAE
jgi:hypothetical protein